MKKLSLTTLSCALIMALGLTACNQNNQAAAPTAEPAHAEAPAHDAHTNPEHAQAHNDAHGEGMPHGEGMAHGEGHAHPDMTPEGTPDALGKDYSIYQIGGEWEDQNAKKHNLDELKGKYQVVAMAYTSCQHTCPFIVRSIKQMERELSKEALANTSFTLVTFDTKRDTPILMTNHIKHNELNDNWRWLRSDDASTRMLANTLNIKYHYAENGDINHSNTVSILDKEGRLVAQGNGVSDSGIKPLIEYLNKNAI